MGYSKNNIAKINIEKVTVSYSEKVKLNRVLKTLTSDEEVVRAFLIDRLVNELDYKPENLEIEKEYNITGGRQSLTPRIDVLVKDENLRTKINRTEIESLGRNLHNVLWGGGGTNDSEIFYSLVNIILAKIQDEDEEEDEEEYDFQIYQYGHNIESPEKIFDRVNGLYKRALKEQLTILDNIRKEVIWE